MVLTLELWQIKLSNVVIEFIISVLLQEKDLIGFLLIYHYYHFRNFSKYQYLKSLGHTVTIFHTMYPSIIYYTNSPKCIEHFFISVISPKTETYVIEITAQTLKVQQVIGAHQSSSWCLHHNIPQYINTETFLKVNYHGIFWHFFLKLVF